MSSTRSSAANWPSCPTFLIWSSSRISAPGQVSSGRRFGRESGVLFTRQKNLFFRPREKFNYQALAGSAKGGTGLVAELATSAFLHEPFVRKQLAQGPISFPDSFRDEIGPCANCFRTNGSCRKAD